jgi:hypothetical protein
MRTLASNNLELKELRRVKREGKGEENKISNLI